MPNGNAQQQQDPAQAILAPLSVPQSVKADAWDVFSNASDEQDFTSKMGALGIPREAKAALWDAKWGGAAPRGQVAAPPPANQPRLEGMASAATGLSAQPKPGILERLKQVFTQGVPRYSTRTIENPQFGEEQLISPEAALSPAEQTRHPIAAGAGEALGSFTSPENLAILAASGGLGELGGVAGQTARRLVSAGFAEQAAENALRDNKEYQDALRRGDTETAKRILGQFAVNAVAGTLAGKHAVFGEAPAPLGTLKRSEAAAAEPITAPAAAKEEPKVISDLPPEEAAKLSDNDFQRWTRPRAVSMARPGPEAEGALEAFEAHLLRGDLLGARSALSRITFLDVEGEGLTQEEKRRNAAVNEKLEPKFRAAEDRLRVAELRETEKSSDEAAPAAAPSTFTATPAEPRTLEKAEASDSQRLAAQQRANLFPNPEKRGYAADYLKARLEGGTEPDRGPLSAAAAHGVQQSIDEKLSATKPAAPAERYSADILDEAKQEITAAQELWSSLPPPGRFEAVAGEPGTIEERGAGYYGINSPRPSVEQMHPWLADAPDVTLAKLSDAMQRGKGAEYNRILDRAAGYIQAQREEAAPVVAEFAPSLRELAGQVQDTEPELAATLGDLANGKIAGIRNLRDYIGRKVTDATEAAGLKEALAELDRAQSGQPLSEGAAEPVGAGGEARPQEGILPGLAPAVSEDKAAAGRRLSEQLAQQFARPPESIEQTAGEMERTSPLFRGTAASPQREIFGEPAVQPVGPGTPAVGQSDFAGSSLRQLSDSIGRVTSAEQSPVERISIATKIADKSTEARGAAAQAIGRMKAVGAAMHDIYAKPPAIDDYIRAKGEYTLAAQKSAVELNRFSKEMVAAVPDAKQREAMGVFIESGGNHATLADWAARSKPADRGKYERALRLNSAQQTIANNIAGFQDERAQTAIDEGILSHARENYLMHVWNRANDFTRGAVNLIRTEMLQTNPRFARRRIFATIFDGEQSGHSARTTDIGALAAAHEHALNEAIAARAFIKSLLDGKAKDGRPIAAVSGSGVPITKDDVNEAYLIRPSTLPKGREGGASLFPHGLDLRDYRPIDHPALRKWKWVANDSDGKPIYVQGDIVIHPDFHGDLRNVLTRSALRAWNIPGTDIRPGAAALRLSQEFKNTLLAFAGFHQVQVGLHGMEHRINPSNLTELDLDDPRQASLVRGGLQVASWGDQDRVWEGLAGGGFVEKIPLAGPKLAQYRSYLFQSYIPRLKMTMGLAALARNEDRYGGKLSAEQIAKLTANQANAAFGQQNYTMLGRNKTFQDLLQLALLAPDFLEARSRFVAQALKPYGREQLEALALGAATLYVGARILNRILDGDAHWSPQDAFSIVYKGQAHVLRTVQGDLLHLLTDPRSFVYNRLNPIYGRGTVEALTGRDKYDRKRTVGEEVRDIATGGVPIPIQGLLKSTPSTLLESFLTSMGIGSFQYRSPAARLAHQYRLDALPSGELSPEEREASRVRSRLVEEIRLGKATPQDLANAFHSGQITNRQYREGVLELRRTPLQADVSALPLEQALQVWQKASPRERMQIARVIVEKSNRVLPDRTATERAKLLPEVRQIFQWVHQGKGQEAHP